EQVSGKPLGALFDTWLFRPSKPAAGARTVAAPVRPKSWQKIAATNSVHQN
ncbi:M1 family peptidase, partial [Streptomyces sp. NPDC002920]